METARIPFRLVRTGDGLPRAPAFNLAGAEVLLERMREADLWTSDKAILDELAVGARTRGYLIDNLSISAGTVDDRLEVLESAGHIGCLHEESALFELLDDPRA